MKGLILLQCLFLMTLQILAQTKTVIIQGIVNDTTIKNIELTHPVDDKLFKWEKTKMNVINDSFKTTIQIPCPIPLAIAYRGRNYTTNYVDGDTKFLIDTGGNLHVIGSSMQNEYEKEFLPFFKKNDQFYDTLENFYRRSYQKYDNDWPQLIHDSANYYFEKYYHQRVELLGVYVESHPNSYVALWDVYYYLTIGVRQKYFNFEKLFSTFSSPMQNQLLMLLMKEKLKESSRLEVGKEFPQDFFIGYERMQRQIRENKQYYLIDFWYSHCGPCIAGFPRLKKIYDQFYRKGFDIVSISVDKQKDIEDYSRQIKESKLLWNHIWDKDGATAYRFSISTFPTYILVDKNGQLVKFYNTSELNQLEDFLTKNL